MFGLLNCHTNIQLLTISDQPGPVEDYLRECLAKMSEMRLERFASTILVAMNKIQEVKIRAPDTRTELRNSIFFTKNIKSIKGRMRA